MISYMSRGNKNVEEMAEMTQIYNGIATILNSSQAACANNLTNTPYAMLYWPTASGFPGRDPAGSAPQSKTFVDASNNPAYTVTSPAGKPPYTGQSVTIYDWYLTYSGQVTHVPGQPATVGEVNGYLNIDFQSILSGLANQQVSLGIQQKTMHIPVLVSVAEAPGTGGAGTTLHTNSTGGVCQTSTNSTDPWEWVSGAGTNVVLTNPGVQVLVNEPSGSGSNKNAALEVMATGGANPGIHSTDTVLFDTSEQLGVTGSSSGTLTINDGAAAPGGLLEVDPGGLTTGTTLGTAAISTGGTIYAGGSITAGTFFYSPSDRNLKRDIQSLDGLALVERLKGHRFVWKKSGQPDMGVIAQEVEKIAPEIVHTNAKGMKTVRYDSLIAPLIEAVKTEQKEIVKLRAEVDALKRGRTLSSQKSK